jgi:hypothetical protein
VDLKKVVEEGRGFEEGRGGRPPIVPISGTSISHALESCGTWCSSTARKMRVTQLPLP